ncbi:MAG: hypothetical protein V4555_17045, partial [Acidobacteriota bacterium]
MLPLTETTLARINALFPECQRESAIELLEQRCADNLPFFEQATPESSERIRHAVLKLSGGRFPSLLQAVTLANKDWRDILVAAGFATDPQAHTR